MSKGAKQAIFIALAAVVIVAVMFTVTSDRTKSTGTAPLASQNTQAQEQVDPALLQRIQTLESTIKATPKDVKALTELGQLYFNLGEMEKSTAAFKAALVVEPNNAVLHNSLGFALFWSGQGTEAVAEFRKAIELDPKGAEAYFNLALALSHNQPSDIPGALENWQKVVELSPADSPIAKKSQEYIDKNKSGTRDTSTAPSVGKP